MEGYITYYGEILQQDRRRIMKITKKICTIVIMFTMFQTVVSTLAFAQPRALPTTHYMAGSVRLVTKDSSATDNTLPNIMGPIGRALIFKTFDQITCNAGSYEVSLRIVNPENNVVVTATKPVAFTATNDGYVYTQPAVWQVLFPAVGWYRFDVLINGQPIASYYFVVSLMV